MYLHHERLVQGAVGTFPLLAPRLSREEIWGLEVPRLAMAGCLRGRAVSSAGCGTSCPPSDAKGRFPALELILKVFPGAAQLPSSAEAVAEGRRLQARATPTHGSAARRPKPCHPGRLLLPWLSLRLSTS